MLSCTLFSADLADLDEGRAGSAGEFADTVAEFASTVGVPNVLDYFPAVAALDPQRLRRRLSRVFTRLFAEFDEQIERRMRERDAGELPKNDFLDVLLDYRTTEDGRQFDRQTLRICLARGVIQARMGNGSAAMKAREELTRVIGSKPEIDESDIDNLEYLQAVVKETCRLDPPAPLLIPHRAETDTEIRGYTVPKGATVLENIWAIGRDSKFEPDKFIPERFLQKEVDFRGRDFELIPFGSGRRICPGLPLAVRMMHPMLASLLHQFEWRLPPEVEKNGVDMEEKFGIVMTLATPLQAMLHQFNTSSVL
uniref:Cytochrome P450 n=1 Tax=Oryza meridionalis TaxID=40149 RepID=A0A0E0CY13_9ORYZ